MRGEGGASRGRAWHRALVSGAGAAALLLTAGAGVFSGATAGARMLEGADGEPQRTSVGRITAVEQRGDGQQGPAVGEIEQTPETIVNVEQTAAAPVSITEARMRQVTREQLRRANEERGESFDGEEAQLFITLPSVTLLNVSGKAVREVGVGFTTGASVNVIAGYDVSMAPGESQTIRSNWRRRNVIMPGNLADVKLSVVWVSFADGTQWGGRARAPHPPSPPNAPNAPEAPDAPNSLNAPNAPSAPDPGPRVVVSGEGMNVTVVAGRASGGVAVAGSGAGGGSSAGGGSGSGVSVGEGGGGGNASAGGGTNVGGLDGQKLYAPPPVYPPIATAANAEGTVRVRITVNEDGNVVAAEAVSGHPLLQQAAVAAARAAKFKPTVVGGSPVKVSGVISYNFTLK